MVRRERIRVLKKGNTTSGPVVYWMSRDQRIWDNWAFLYAQEIAMKARSSLAVVFCLLPDFLNATVGQYGFLLRGLEEVEQRLLRLKIPFFLLQGPPAKEIPRFMSEHNVNVVVTDFDPLKPKRQWKEEVEKLLNISFYEVDAHNIIPCWFVSPKQEYGAYTIRPKIRRLLAEFVEEFPPAERHPVDWIGGHSRVDWRGVRKNFKEDGSIHDQGWTEPGEKAARSALALFLEDKLEKYNQARNDPNKAGQSDLSPYLHFGQLSAQRVVLETLKSRNPGESRDAYLEELIVRRELSDNFCFYNRHYDSFEGFPEWAKKTLDQHREDQRPYIYSLKEFEEARTHDILWNAAQMEMVKRGKMHGYMRMYWAKKILEWTRTPEEAMDTAIYLNNRYELDGRDPNGYAGIAWSIGGVHDRAWNERNIFGKIRYMSYNGCKSKFDIDSYIKRVHAM